MINSKREKEILKLRKKGMTHREIAKELGISEKTSRNYVSASNRLKKFIESLGE